MSKKKNWEDRIRQLKNETYAIYLASKDPRVPWYAKALIFFVVAHTFSPIDLIPDFIPVIGYLDDLIITPLGIILAIKLIPSDVLAECREKAQQVMADAQPSHWKTSAVIIAIWIVMALIFVVILWRYMGHEK